MKKSANLAGWWKALLLSMLAVGLCTAASSENSPWVRIAPGTKIHSMMDIPLKDLHRNPERYIGTVFEDQFKFYHIYHNRKDANPALRGQVILGKTHFTARPVFQDLYVIQITITPAQEAWIHAHGIVRQDAIHARVRFSGIAPGEVLAFELLEIQGAPEHRRRP